MYHFDTKSFQISRQKHASVSVASKTEHFPTRWQQLCMHHGNLDLLPGDADESVQGEQNDGPQQEEVSERGLNKPTSPMQQHQNEEDDIGVVCDPEGAESVATCVLHGKDVDNKHVDGQEDSGETCEAQGQA